jgi:hypothetical protein
MELCWYKNDKLHRDGDLPAVVDENEKYWYKDGKRHRDPKDINGNLLPAVVDGDDKSWYINDEKIQ